MNLVIPGSRSPAPFASVRLAIVALLALLNAPGLTRAAPPLARGADIGWLSQFEAQGVTWRNVAGRREEPLRILADAGLNALRLRVFVHPPADALVKGAPLGFCDQAHVVAMAVRARRAGFTRFLIDFHYSDTWADPGKQPKPAAWAGHSMDQLADDVYQHTRDVMQALADAGIRPEWVQVGNEINGGMLWPEGSTKNFAQLARLINRGYDAVKSVSPGSKVVIHLANGWNNALFRWWFDQLVQEKGRFDVIGMSYYPYWDKVDYTENIAALRANLADMAQRYGRPVLVAEVGGLETKPANTLALLKATIAAVQAVPGGNGLGVFYWEPEANASVTHGYPLGATTEIARHDLQFTEALNAFAVTTPDPALKPPASQPQPSSNP